jgi:large-conductance mechanosensitive channel
MDQNSRPSNTPVNDGKTLGVAGLIIGTLSLMFSFIPCIGMWALVPAIVGIILSAISLSLASKAGLPKSNALAGLICSIIAFLVAAYWIFMTVYMVSNSSEVFMEMHNEIQQSGVIDSLSNAIQQEITITDTVNK